MSTMAESLKSVPLFSELSDRELRTLAQSMHEKRYEDGQEVVTQGESGIGFFVILEGGARVTVGGQDRRTLKAGDYFGELALLEGENRSASITADQSLRCAGMTAWHFRPFVRDHPDIAWSLLKELARRLRQAEASQGG
jgi:CRP/FNR family transcriptional regulator, cyclic AMP receptor protein